jgi:acyl-CoA synthetase (AMP-forming)/AMP-acid ligase II
VAASTVGELVAAQARERPDATYFIATETGRTLTFGALEASCRGVGAFITAKAGSAAHVSVVMPNGLATLRILLGALAAGHCVNPVNLLSQAEQMAYVLDHSDSTLVFASPEWTPRVREMVRKLTRAVEVIEVDPDAAMLPFGESAAPPALPAVDPDALALLMYTSGTTGKPKGVMLTQSNLVANARCISEEHELGSSDRVTAVLPLYHINAFAVTMLAPLAHGGSLAMPPKFSASRFWELPVRHGCTWLNMVPTKVSDLL